MPSDDVSMRDWLDQGPTDADEVARHYDAWAQDYEDDLGSWLYQAPTVVAQTVMARQPEAASVLDAGCGTGLVGRTLRGLGFTGRLDGVDLSRASLEIAGRSGAYDSLTQGDLQQGLEVADDAVDAVVCVGVMSYIPDVEPVWRDLARVVRPGGTVSLTQREDLWQTRGCQDVVDRLEAEGVWTPLDVTGPAPYLPGGHGAPPAVLGYYLTARVA